MPQPKKAKGRTRRRAKKNVLRDRPHQDVVQQHDRHDHRPRGQRRLLGVGSLGRFKGSRKSTPFAAQVTADAAARKGMEHGVERVEVHAKGARSGRDTAIRSLQAAGLQVTTVKDVSPQAHNGCRPKKRRRP